jgi:ribosomal protein S18 acetylase RimI-like enzyme
MTSDIRIRPLSADDFADFKALRLEALRDSPEAFSASYEENLARPDDYFLALMGAAPDIVLGAFDGAALVGKAGFQIEKGLKSRHKGFMWGVYVAPAWRGRGVGANLVRGILDHARRHVEILRSAVTATNANAAELYHRLGFETYGVEPLALRVAGRSLDEELIAIRFDGGRPVEQR